MIFFIFAIMKTNNVLLIMLPFCFNKVETSGRFLKTSN